MIQTLAHKVKYIGQINGGLMSKNSRVRFFEISWLNCEYERINKGKRNKINIVQC